MAVPLVSAALDPMAGKGVAAGFGSLYGGTIPWIQFLKKPRLAGVAWAVIWVIYHFQRPE